MITTLILSSIICILPVLFCSILFSAGLKVKPLHILLAILLGVIAFFPVQMVDEFVVRKFISRFYPTRRAFLTWVFLAEIIKGAFLILLPSKKMTLRSFLLASMLAGLTFGCGQTIVECLYQIGNTMSQSGNAQILWFPLLLKLICIDIINMSCTGLAGLFIWTCKQKKINWFLLFYPFVLRALFEFFNVKLDIKWFTAAAILLALLECRIKYKALSDTGDE